MPLIELVPPSTLPRGWYIDRPSELRLRLALIHPIDARIAEQPAIAHRDMDPGIAIAVSRLQQQHSVASGFAEPGRHDAARRSRPGHDIVEGALAGRHLLPRQMSWLGCCGAERRPLHRGRGTAIPRRPRS